ncbi:Ferritin heavy chain [Frankliniella fusca]|uniref:Ferritin n=1 Tax=Frankliniella fusca TaxID=407009 RepID=A0AAE1LHV8_9NEOP|nr:Ferritin heavy chain [Frankliniella fusca]
MESLYCIHAMVMYTLYADYFYVCSLGPRCSPQHFLTAVSRGRAVSVLEIGNMITTTTTTRPLRSSQLLAQAAPIRHASVDVRGDNPTRLQYPRQVEEAVNRQINSELSASYAYLAMASFFALPTVALRGLESHCWSMSRREHRDALRLAAYQTSRGAGVCLSEVAAPQPAAPHPHQQPPAAAEPEQALTASLELQRCLTENLLDLHELASGTGDPVTCDFIATRFLNKQVKRLEAAGRYLTQLRRLGASGQGLHDFDEWLARQDAAEGRLDRAPHDDQD